MTTQCSILPNRVGYLVHSEMGGIKSSSFIPNPRIPLPMKSKSLLDEITQAITAETPEPELTPITAVELPEVYYDGRLFYIPNSSGGWALDQEFGHT